MGELNSLGFQVPNFDPTEVGAKPKLLLCVPDRMASNVRAKKKGKIIDESCLYIYKNEHLYTDCKSKSIMFKIVIIIFIQHNTRASKMRLSIPCLGPSTGGYAGKP